MRKPRILRTLADQVGDAPGRIVLDFEAAGFRNIPLVGRYAYRRAQAPLEPHSHGNVFEVSLLARGEQTYVARGSEYPLHGGDLFVTKPKEPHGTGNTPEEPGVLYWLQFRHPGEHGRLLELSVRETRELVAQYEALGEHVYHGGMGLVPLWDRILETYAEAGTPLEKANLRNLLLRLLFDILDVTRKHGESPVSSPIRDSLTYIEDHITDAISIEEMALRVDLSLSHFKTRFREEIGTPPGEYIARRRIDIASERLQRTAASITDIAFALGFSSSQYFATVFRRFTGLTPRQYRKGIQPIGSQ